MWKTLVLTIAFVNSAAFRLKELISKNYVSTFWFTTVYKYFKYCTTEEKLFPIQPFHYISFPENFTDSRMESRSSLASQKYPLGNKANSLNPCFFFPFAVSASCIISSTNANKTINDFSLFTNRFLLISSVTNVSKMTFPILKVTLLLHKLAQHWLP